MLEKADTATVRDLETEDLPAVAGLFQKTFRGTASVPPSLLTYLHEILFDHPWYDQELRSKVFVAAHGQVRGFIGVFPARLEWEGRSLRAAFAGSMMVERPEEHPLAGARLLRAFLNGPQDLSLTETANATALGMWQKLSLPLDVAYSLNWLRILRPAAAAVNLMENAVSAARLLRPISQLADTAAEKLGLSVFHAPAAQASGRVRFQDAMMDEFVDAALTLKQEFPLRPQWDRHSLEWLLAHAAQKRRFGDPSWRVGISRDGEPVACYAYFGRPGGIGWLLQALCKPAAADDLVDDLFGHADGTGCAGIRGAGHPWLTPALITRRTIFHGRTFYLAHARDKTLLQPIQSGQALVSGLAGEKWMRLIGDRFD
ncbi:hypothetical protein ABID21_003339 [Pseudorhizobium tarimense]|uniref:GNAT family N-acetyltransferase n=1 Tax=Pseudorhizobium tarimense TaxID=1079109 RepID=A0ABV2H9J6_9HYPH|nr:hypothetical protein [Pseudorhizobium tarimense]MCJ8520459.1 hypothetical protein [Pseudorhizobium tarimense]